MRKHSIIGSPTTIAWPTQPFIIIMIETAMTPNTEEYCGRLKNTVSAASHSSDVAIKNSAPNTMLWNKV
ncbi:unnamed protein product [Fusarium graminearum]|nr:unnamed protein product [Fusarium graminearum]